MTRRTTVRRPTVVLLALFLGMGALLAGACGRTPEEVTADREEIAGFLREYLPTMSEAYRTGDAEPLSPYAAQKERESIERRVREMAKQGQIIDPELESLEVESIRIWGAVNAYVTTVEVWDIRVRASGSEQVVGEELDQVNRVTYQLKRENDRWRVFWRQLEQTVE